ncbi:LPS O-antigen chain length determinant protein WzzB [Rodentibacter pneumotropicus]|uniref:Chain length determination protein n=3 Tax=Rodentibacter pneumotropicus TaxID=758 RepID=A0A4S2QH42_9PAST|nr:Wzz/FepE/Etk N-terminal domain-containing protein [Rodentibacter pneumotropicus]NBH74435.1 chain length determination protein [Rodentibacter pneumotropicus]TGZ99249.1 chain length determination protein [Rodentibacter pneumotropicus]TGZ99748.1 chain length determination protein [Rodentibacter pneumotropicus]THA00906.1 chain length determination protein [Rodentibacter pneumotropicus]THA06752.1 chain length determination protein [Rodentibacter pneumotropicus]
MNNTNAANNDEIDLIELIKVLWNKKIWILLSAFVCSLIAGVYAFTAKEQWTSKAEVIEPKISDLGEYFNVRKEYARILGQEFDVNGLRKSLFDKFNLMSESLDTRKTFFEQSDIYQQLSKNKEELSKRRILSDLMTKDINITKPDPKKEPDLLGRRIKFIAETPLEAQETLQQFITFAGKEAYQLEVENFLIDFNEVVSDLTYEKIRFERDLAIQKKVQLENLNNALKIAQEAGIKDYAKSFGTTADSLAQALAMSEVKLPLSDSKLSDGAYLFMLGEKYLKAQVEVLNQEAIVYPPRYYQVTAQLEELEPLLRKVKESKVNAFSYHASPDYPVMKDKPKKALILVIGFIIGVILSTLIILFASVIQNGRKV